MYVPPEPPYSNRVVSQQDEINELRRQIRLALTSIEELASIINRNASAIVLNLRANDKAHGRLENRIKALEQPLG